MPLVPPHSSADANITSKFEAVTGHLTKAMDAALADDVEEALYISFASAHANADLITPNVYAFPFFFLLMCTRFILFRLSLWEMLRPRA
jgi:hypothetical protein